MQLFHHTEFSDRDALFGLKLQLGHAVSVCIPTLNEAATIGEIVSELRQMCMRRVRLIDEILVIDSGSNDDTCKIASEAGAAVWKSAEISPDAGSHIGKGENLWKALHVARGDIICYLDADVVNFHGGFLCGLLGPLLKNPSLSYVKAYYQRPLMEQDIILPDSGGRVSEILVRPLISMFYPELVDVIQPLAGEYAARRELLEQLAYPVGYGVEIAHLIDLAAMGKLDHFGQTDLSCRVHRNRDDGELGDAAYTILQVILRRLQRDGKINLNGCHGNTHHRWLMGTDGLRKISKSLPEPERPPIQSWLMQHDMSLCVKASVEDARSHL